MEEQNLNQFEDRIEPQIRLSRDGKWVIIRVLGIEQPIIKAAAYFRKILERVGSTQGYDVEKIKG